MKKMISTRMSTRISVEYSGFERQENLDIVHRRLTQCADLIPGNVQRLIVTLYTHLSEENNILAQILLNNDYLFYELHISTSFLDISEYEQLFTIAHELHHIVLAPFKEIVTNRLMEPVRESNNALWQYMKKDITTAEEQAIQHLSRVFVDRFAYGNS